MRTKTNIFPTNQRPECGADAPQYGRLLSLCAGDAPQVSNDVYNQRYTSEKVASRSKQSGRSMIEMLGVLAIIGILTVGSITGYSHAMRRHLLNKQREQISYILSAVETHREMLDTSPNSTLPRNLKPIFETFGWIPEEMIKDNSGYIYDVFKNSMYLHNSSLQNYMGLRIDLANDNPHEQCVNLYQVIKPYHSFLWITEVETNPSSFANKYYGDKYCGGSPKCIRELTPAKISELCRLCDGENSCKFYILWK